MTKFIYKPQKTTLKPEATLDRTRKATIKDVTTKGDQSLCQNDTLTVRYPHARTDLPGLFCVGNVNEFVPFFITVNSLLAHNFAFFLTKAGIRYQIVAELVKVGDFLLVYRRVFDNLLHNKEGIVWSYIFTSQLLKTIRIGLQ